MLKYQKKICINPLPPPPPKKKKKDCKLLKLLIAAVAGINDEEVIFRNCAPFPDSIIKINNT